MRIKHFGLISSACVIRQPQLPSGLCVHADPCPGRVLLSEPGRLLGGCPSQVDPVPRRWIASPTTCAVAVGKLVLSPSRWKGFPCWGRCRSSAWADSTRGFGWAQRRCCPSPLLHSRRRGFCPGPVAAASAGRRASGGLPSSGRSVGADSQLLISMSDGSGVGWGCQPGREEARSSEPPALCSCIFPLARVAS